MNEFYTAGVYFAFHQSIRVCVLIKSLRLQVGIGKQMQIEQYHCAFNYMTFLIFLILFSLTFVLLR